MAATGTGSQHSAGYIVESTYGTTPATPAFANIRHNSMNLGLTKNVLESEEIRSDRQVVNLRHGTKTVSGEIGFELTYGTFDSLFEAAMGGTWSTNVLKAGTTRRSFTIERKFANLATPEYHRYTGVEFDGFSLSVTPDAIVSGSFTTMGQDYAIATAAIAGATYPAATTTIPITSFSGSVNEGGSSIAIITSIEMTLENGLSPLHVVGSDLTNQPGIARSRVSGTLGLWFQSKALLDKFINETASSIDFTLTDGTSSYTFDMGNVKYNGGQPDVDGDGEIQISLPFTALYNSGDASQLMITRVP